MTSPGGTEPMTKRELAGVVLAFLVILFVGIAL